MNFGDKLSMLRRQKKLHQKQLAEILGVSQTTYSGYERGICEPSIDVICRLAKFHDMSIEELVDSDARASDGYASAAETWEQLGCKVSKVSVESSDKAILVETPEPKGLYYIEGNTLPRGFWFEDRYTFTEMTRMLQADYERDSRLHKQIYFFNRMIRFLRRDCKDSIDG